VAASFTDAGVSDGPSTYTVTWGYGTAAASGTQAARGGVLAPTHGYAKAGTHAIAVRVADRDGATGTATAMITAAQPKGKHQPRAAPGAGA
jgi:hypothetical protein